MSTLLRPVRGQMSSFFLWHRGQPLTLLIDLRSETVASFCLQSDSMREAAGWLYAKDGTDWDVPGADWHISNLYIAPHLRRQGLATALYEQAQEVFPDLVHDEVEMMSKDGLAFAAVVGGAHLVLPD